MVSIQIGPAWRDEAQQFLRVQQIVGLTRKLFQTVGKQVGDRNDDRIWHPAAVVNLVLSKPFTPHTVSDR